MGWQNGMQMPQDVRVRCLLLQEGAAPGAHPDDTPCHPQELFNKVTRYECEAYVAYKPHMGRRYQPEKASIEHVAPTIHKVMKQFEATVRLVTTCCLGTPSMMARDRARVVEFWIRVAKECETFLNFASLHAILLALQCPPVGRLKRTWGHVSWKSAYIFKKLKKKDKKADRQWFHEEAKRLLTRWQWDQRTPDYQENQGMVPFLGYILDDVPMEQLTEHNDEVSEPSGAQGVRMVSFGEERAPVSPHLSVPAPTTSESLPSTPEAGPLLEDPHKPRSWPQGRQG
ncbi:ral-GDS-related protein-like [Manis javanica]|uniref:ral-GDS-related protein-like n=1 Tax=Manis javanica TaxID=9974 RepID=UPI003C6D465F